ncbi:zinc finger, CCHC-type containing protein [Tanacetum coccineum]
MGDENSIRTLGDYSRPSHKGYRNTIELPERNNMVPLQSDTIRLVQNGCSFHELRSKDLNQHLKDFLKLADSLDLDGSISIREDLTTRFLAQFFLPGRTTKLYNDILMFQQHHGESLSEAWTRFKDLLQKVSHHGIDRWLEIQIFYDHVSFHLKCEINRASGGKLRNKNVDESWEIIENLALYDHEGWYETKEFIKPIKAISTSVMTNAHTELSTRTPSLCHCSPSPQPQALNTTFEACVRDYMAVHTKRMERFENTIFKQREEINEEEEGSDRTMMTPNNAEKPTEIEMEMPVMEVEEINEVKNRAKIIKTSETEEAVEAPGSQPVAYYLKHKINKKLIKGIAWGAAYDAILKKMITKKEDIEGNFKIPCSIRNLKHVSPLVDQGFDVNVMPYSTYMKLTDEKPAETDIRLSLASHSYIYSLGISKDVLVEITEHVYPVDFVILDIMENENRPFILGTPFLTTTKDSIKFDTGTITLRSRKHKDHLEKNSRQNRQKKKKKKERGRKEKQNEETDYKKRKKRKGKEELKKERKERKEDKKESLGGGRRPSKFSYIDAVTLHPVNGVI